MFVQFFCPKFCPFFVQNFVHFCPKMCPTFLSKLWGYPPGCPPPLGGGGLPWGCPPCEQTNWKHYLPVILRMRAVKIFMCKHASVLSKAKTLRSFNVSITPSQSQSLLSILWRFNTFFFNIILRSDAHMKLGCSTASRANNNIFSFKFRKTACSEIHQSLFRFELMSLSGKYT